MLVIRNPLKSVTEEKNSLKDITLGRYSGTTHGE